MIGKFTVLNGNTKVTFEVTANTTLVLNVVTHCAEYLFERGFGDHGTIEDPIVFDDLSNQQRLDLVADHLQKVVLDLANSHKSNQAQEEARKYEQANEYQF